MTKLLQSRRFVKKGLFAFLVFCTASGFALRTDFGNGIATLFYRLLVLIPARQIFGGESAQVDWLCKKGYETFAVLSPLASDEKLIQLWKENRDSLELWGKLVATETHERNWHFVQEDKIKPLANAIGFGAPLRILSWYDHPYDIDAVDKVERLCYRDPLSMECQKQLYPLVTFRFSSGQLTTSVGSACKGRHSHSKFLLYFAAGGAPQVVDGLVVGPTHSSSNGGYDPKLQWVYKLLPSLNSSFRDVPLTESAPSKEYKLTVRNARLLSERWLLVFE
jgi:hypothetical protein